MGRLQSALTKSVTFARTWTPKVVRALVVLSILLLGAISLVALVVLKRQGDLPPMAPAVARLVALGAFALMLAALWRVPRWQARALGAEASARERSELIDRHRRTLAAIVGGVVLVLLCGNAVRVAGVVQARVMTDRFMAAADRLGGERMTTRLAAVYAMESLASAEASVRRPVLETLLAFVRQRTQEETGRDSMPPSPDVVAAVTVLSRRADDGGLPPFRPDFSGANLRGAALAGAQWDFSALRGTHLEGADLRGASMAGKGGSDLRGIRLDGANLAGAQLDGARLTDGAVLAHANLRGADLDGASLHGADLRFARLDSAGLAGATLKGALLDSATLSRADLAGATLSGATLMGTDFAGAVLRNAQLKGTDLRWARNLTASQLEGARIDSTTLLPSGMTRPARLPSEQPTK